MGKVPPEGLVMTMKQKFEPATNKAMLQVGKSFQTTPSKTGPSPSPSPGNQKSPVPQAERGNVQGLKNLFEGKIIEQQIRETKEDAWTLLKASRDAQNLSNKVTKQVQSGKMNYGQIAEDFMGLNNGQNREALGRTAGKLEVIGKVTGQPEVAAAAASMNKVVELGDAIDKGAKASGTNKDNVKARVDNIEKQVRSYTRPNMSPLPTPQAQGAALAKAKSASAGRQ